MRQVWFYDRLVEKVIFFKLYSRLLLGTLLIYRRSVFLQLNYTIRSKYDNSCQFTHHAVKDKFFFSRLVICIYVLRTLVHHICASVRKRVIWNRVNFVVTMFFQRSFAHNNSYRLTDTLKSKFQNISWSNFFLLMV